MSGAEATPVPSDPSAGQADSVVEAVQFSGLVQPHGVLLALSDLELKIVQVSANTLEHWGIPPQNLLHQPINVLLDPTLVNAIREGLQDVNCLSPLTLPIQTANGESLWGGRVHRSEEPLIILELELLIASDAGQLGAQAMMARAIAKLKPLRQFHAFLQGATAEIRQMIKFDRVMVYQFDPQGAGAVIAEAKRADLPPYQGLHYPASDIPEPVRALYRRGLLRVIPDLRARSLSLIPAQNPITQQPLNLNLAVLRGVDSCCVEYHQNMGVAAILVIPLIHDQTLWGLIACHHQTTRAIPYETRAACELLGQFISSELAHQINAEKLDSIVRLRSLQSEFVDAIAQVDDLTVALTQPAHRLLDLVNAQGAAVCLDNEITLLGTTPKPEQVRTLIDWADTHSRETLFHTAALPKLYPAAETFKNSASGVLILQISNVQRYTILWFRPEVLKTVTWAGEPTRSIAVEADGSIRRSPRQSFDQWQETVRFTSLPWKQGELENALDLRSAIVGIVIRKADELARINQELERSNRELDSFAYAASHDLKEPLRGIHNYSNLLIKDYGSVLDEVGKSRLQTLIRLTRRMESLIDVLLKFSRLGQTDLHVQPTDLHALVQQVIEDLRVSRQESHPIIDIPRSLPTVKGDPTLLNEVFTNLLSNAFKYNDKPDPSIEIGYLDLEEQRVQKISQPQSPLRDDSSTALSTPILYIRDNGIGIRDRHLQIIFRLFKRLHEQHLYGGGTGAGLTIAKKIIERHGGQIWLESAYGQGTTFYFTLDS